jgi:DNA-binding winged helix-turn-helix (wHTH) protein
MRRSALKYKADMPRARASGNDMVLGMSVSEGSTGDAPDQPIAELLSVEPKVFDVLAFLIDNSARVVSKDDLIASIWKGRIVSESALTTCINAARSVIGDSGRTQRLIKKLPRKGFRFVAAVQEALAPILPDKPSIAVLPFSNLSSDPAQEYFAEGVVEEIITTLSRMRWLFVIARN